MLAELRAIWLAFQVELFTPSGDIELRGRLIIPAHFEEVPE